METRLQRLANQLRLRGISLNAPLRESDLCAFERRHRVELPTGYRQFVRHIGDGGSAAGPDGVELFRLGQYPPDRVPKPEYVELTDLAEPFPFTETKVWEAQCDWEEYQDDLSRLHHGNLCLADCGCALCYHLIVTGPERGNVWQFAWDTGICPAGTAPEFLDWYEAWLNA